MKLSISDSYTQMSTEAARSTARQLIKEPYTVLGLPTGNTPKKFYKQMVAYYEADLVDFSEVTTFNLDEFYRIESNHPQSYRKYMEDRFYSKVNLKERNYHIPDGTTDKPQKVCKNYDRLISDSGGIDLQILGIGRNGHLGFNEPGSSWGETTRLVKLNAETLEEKFENDNNPPSKAFTMGIKNIMRADKVYLLASGKDKAQILEKALEGAVTREIPASILQLHPEVSVFLDQDAALRLDNGPS